jgi:hypothetical protein
MAKAPSKAKVSEKTEGAIEEVAPSETPKETEAKPVSNPADAFKHKMVIIDF